MSISLPDLVITISTKPSTALGEALLKFMDFVTIYAPAALTGTITVQASDDGTTFYNVGREGGTDADLVVAVDEAVNVPIRGYKALRVNSGSDEGAARTFKTRGVEKLSGVLA